MKTPALTCLLLVLAIHSMPASAGFYSSDAGGVLTELALDVIRNKSGTNSANVTTPASETQEYTVEAVLDGDTIAVRSSDGRTSHRIRFAMIDAPEKNQEWGMASKASLVQLLRGTATVRIESYGHDSYGRMIGIVFDDRGRNVNLLQLENGAAWLYSLYATKPQFAGHLQSFKAAEQRARMQRLGLWGNPSPTPPWQFRRS